MPVEKPHKIFQDEDIELEDYSVDNCIPIQGLRYLVFDGDPDEVAHCVIFSNDRREYLEYCLGSTIEELGYDRRVLLLIRNMNRVALDDLAYCIHVFEKVIQGSARSINAH